MKCKWALLYIERWLTAPMEKEGILVERTRGTPQGGVISPILSNLFLHYAFDLWMKRTHPDLPWCRYADDGLVHCRTEQEAEALKAELQARLEECGLEMHPTKTKIVYCKDGKRKGKYPNVTFDFLGYHFGRGWSEGSRNERIVLQLHSRCQPPALKAIRSTVRDLNIRRQTQCRWTTSPRCSIRSYGDGSSTTDDTIPRRWRPSSRYVNLTLWAWVMRKFKRFKGDKIRPAFFWRSWLGTRPGLFEHWRIGMIGAFA